MHSSNMDEILFQFFNICIFIWFLIKYTNANILQEVVWQKLDDVQ